jgi:GNAT superfamily N-acetyltransferase
MSPAIRRFCHEDCAAVVALENRELPPHRHYAVEDWRRRLAPHPHQEALRLVAGDPVVAYLEVMGYSNIPRDRVRASLHLLVAREHRRRGLGSALYEHALAFAHERQVSMLQARFYQYTEDEPAIAFLRQRGFIEAAQERRQTSHLDLAAFDPSRFADLMQRVERQGVHIVPCKELPDTIEHRRLLYDLFLATEMLWESTPFEAWGLAPERWRWAQETLTIAEADGRWVSFTQVARYNEAAGVWRTAHAATLPAYRNQGIYTAVKLRSIEMLRQRGCRVLLTSNGLNNAPILAINRKLDSVPGPLEVSYRKAVREGA